ncbi:MAG: ABC transporter ATP-binding protein [Bacteroidetes bacterium]|nr:ABC transporter ATP-binding protein [Bacteroidota bacterium]
MSQPVSDDEVSGKSFDLSLLRRLLVFIAPYKKLVVAGVLISVAGSVLGPLRPWLAQIAIDQHIATADWEGLHLIGSLILLLLILDVIAQYALTYLTQLLGQKAIFGLRETVFSFLQTLNLRFFDRNPIGRLIARVTSDVEVLNELFSSGLVAVFGDLFKLIIILILMFYTDWKLSLVTLSVLPLMIYGSFLFRRKARESYLEVRGHVARLMSFLQEHITGMSIVQIFNREEREARKFAQINRDHRDAHVRGIYYYSVFYPAIDFLSALAIALIVWYGGGEVVQGSLTFGILFMFIQYVEMFFRPIRDMSEKYDILQRAMASSERIFKLLDRQEDVERQSGTLKPDSWQGDIRFQNVWSRYNENDWILKDVSFHVAPGEKIALVGATGAGKTTIISLINRFYPYQQGQIYLDGHPLEAYDLKSLRASVGVVLQDVFLFSGTVYENLTLGRDDFLPEEVYRAAGRVQAHSFIEALPGGYQFQVTERGGNLSAGQRQLISFIRILLFNPPVVILDEATSSVDTDTEHRIQQATETILTGRTAIIIAHRLSTVRICNRIFVMHKGELKETGTHRELMTAGGIYHRLYQLQYQDQESGNR